MFLDWNKTMILSVSRSVSSVPIHNRVCLVRCIRQCHLNLNININAIKGIKNYLLNPQVLHNLNQTSYISISNYHDVGTKTDMQAKKMDQIRKLVEDLSCEERSKLIVALQHQEADEIKKRAEEKLASLRWRSRFGRPSSLPQSSADSTGTLCEIPENWLESKAAEQTQQKPPSWKELRGFAVFNALPFVGFGFLDNAIMILCGEYFDITIGTYLGISTMAAAALGNTISDLAGIGSAWYIEYLVAKVGLRSPSLSPAQLEMSSVRWSANIGRSIGVVIGCLIGMFPLLLLNSPKKEQKKSTESQEMSAK